MSNVDCDSDDEEDEMVIHFFERIQRDQEVENINIESIDDEAIVEKRTKVWFEKLKPLIDHI